MPRIILLCTTLGASLTGLLTADEIPGWTDLSSVAKGSIIAFLCALVGCTLLLLLLTNRNQQKDYLASSAQQQKDYIAEVQASRHDYGAVIKEIRQVITDHLDAQGQLIAGLSVQCAKTQTQMRSAADRRAHDAAQQHVDADVQHVDADRQHDDADRAHHAGQ